MGDNSCFGFILLFDCYLMVAFNQVQLAEDGGAVKVVGQVWTLAELEVHRTMRQAAQVLQSLAVCGDAAGAYKKPSLVRRENRFPAGSE